MSLPARRELTWFIVESQGRWYRAACRFAPQAFGGDVVTRIVQVNGNGVAGLTGLVGRAKATRGTVVVCWDLGGAGEDTGSLERLEAVALVRAEVPAAWQIAYLSPLSPAPWSIAAQEAGISLFLLSLESFPGVAKALARRVHPLG
jgi:hypothetical protein